MSAVIATAPEIDPRLIAGLMKIYEAIDNVASVATASPVDRRLLLHHVADHANGRAEDLLDLIETPIKDTSR